MKGVPFNRHRISPIKTIIVPDKIIKEMWDTAKQTYPNEFAKFMLGDLERKFGKPGNIYDTITVKELYGQESKSSDMGFHFSPESARAAKKYATKKGMQFIGTIHSHPSKDYFDIMQLILSGKDSFYMFRICEFVRGIVAIKDKREGFLIFWAFGKHTPLKINETNDVIFKLGEKN